MTLFDDIVATYPTPKTIHCNNGAVIGTGRAYYHTPVTLFGASSHVLNLIFLPVATLHTFESNPFLREPTRIAICSILATAGFDILKDTTLAI